MGERAAHLRPRDSRAGCAPKMHPCARRVEHRDDPAGGAARLPARRARAPSRMGGRSPRRPAPQRALVLVVMKRDATKAEIDAVVERIKEFGITPVPLPGAERTAIGTFGTTSREAAEAVESLPGVSEVVPVSRPFKLASREVIADDTVVRIGQVPVGDGHPLAVIAGPCAVESREVTLETARGVRAAGGAALRGGAFKPRTSPYSFRGMGEEGLEILTHLPVLADPSHGTGKWYLVAPVALAAVAAGADGLLIEVHPSPDHALSDGFQSLTFDNFRVLMSAVPHVARAVGRTEQVVAR